MRLLTAASVVDPQPGGDRNDDADGSVILVVATEEAIYNSLFRARTVTGRGRTVDALPIERTLAILRAHDLLNP